MGEEKRDEQASTVREMTNEDRELIKACQLLTTTSLQVVILLLLLKQLLPLLMTIWRKQKHPS